MSRPVCYRKVAGRPKASIFKPQGVPMAELEEIVMALDEFEAIRLADLEGLYQENAADRMGISRPTFTRIVDSARRKLADALVHGKAIRIEGGPVHFQAFRCCRLHDRRARRSRDGERNRPAQEDPPRSGGSARGRRGRSLDRQ